MDPGTLREVLNHVRVCPACKSDTRLLLVSPGVGDTWEFNIICSVCSYKGSWETSIEEAAMQWNRWCKEFKKDKKAKKIKK